MMLRNELNDWMSLCQVLNDKKYLKVSQDELKNTCKALGKDKVHSSDTITRSMERNINVSFFNKWLRFDWNLLHYDTVNDNSTE